MPNEDMLADIRSSFDFVEVMNADADFTAIKLKREPFANLVIKFNTVKLSEVADPTSPDGQRLNIDFGYSVVRSYLTKEELDAVKLELDDYVSRVLTYTILWANDTVLC